MIYGGKNWYYVKLSKQTLEKLKIIVYLKIIFLYDKFENTNFAIQFLQKKDLTMRSKVNGTGVQKKKNPSNPNPIYVVWFGLKINLGYFWFIFSKSDWISPVHGFTRFTQPAITYNHKFICYHNIHFHFKLVNISNPLYSISSKFSG